MKKLDIVNKISRDCNLDKKFVAIVVENFMTEIKDSLINGQNIYLRGFGTFRLKKRAKKTARNIAKKTSIVVPEHMIPNFKACKELKINVSKNNPC